MSDPQHASAPPQARPSGIDALYAPALDRAPRTGSRPVDPDLASYPRRIGASVVDALLALVVVGWALLWSPSEVDASRPVWPFAVAGVMGLAFALAQWVLHGVHGWTIGRLAFGVRTVDVETRVPIGMGRVLVRGLVVAAGGLACAVGAFLVVASPLVDPTGRRRGWHDRAARDEVLDARALASATRAGVAPVRRAIALPSPERVVPAGEAARGLPGGAAGPDAVPAPPATVPAWASTALATEAAPRPWSASSTHEMPAVTGSLRLAPLAPQRSGPDLDTRAIPTVRVSAPAPAPAVETVDLVPAPPVGVPAPAVETVDLVPAPPVHEPRTPTFVGLDPALELTHRVVPRPARPDDQDDLGDDDLHGEPVAEETLPLTGPETAEIELSDGRRLYVERTALVGRNPVARTHVRAIRVHDPNRSVSKTHLQIGVEPGGVWIADRGSTNGTVVTLPDGGQVQCGVDQRVRLRVGSVVVFGDCALRLVRGPGSPPAD